MPTAPVKRALIVGIDKYQRISGLEGCSSDAAEIERLLVRKFGFTDVVKLLDSAATRSGILDGLDQLVKSTQTGDIVVFYYAGHGSRIRDREGDEPSGWDCTLVPHDVNAHDGSSEGSVDITDDEIHVRLVALGDKTEHITFIVDACHSGTVTRGVSEPGVGKVRGIPDDPRTVDQLPPSPITSTRTRGAEPSGPSGWLPLDKKYVLIAGCRDDQTSGELILPGNPPIHHGVLTYYLTQALNEMQGRVTYRDVFERASAQVIAFRGTKQHPQIEGTINRELFGTAMIEPMQFIPVAARDAQNGTVTLDAGAALGMTVGSSFDVYPSGTSTVDGVTALGQVQIISVGAFTSTANIASESTAGAIAQGARAVLTTYAAGDRRLVVDLGDLAGDAATNLRGALEKSSLVRVAQAGEQADVRVHLLAPRTSASATDVTPELAQIAEPTWVVINTDGLVAMPPKRETDWALVSENLETISRFRIAMELRNPDTQSALSGKVTMELLREVSDGKWEVAASRPEDGGRALFADRDHVGLRITNSHTSPVYINLIDFDAGCTITRVWPEANAKERIEPGKTYDALTRPGERCRFKLPEAYPFAPINTASVAVEGVETLRLFVTTNEVSFEFLESAGVRGTESPLQMLLRTALQAPATRAPEKEPPIAKLEDWTTVERSFVLRRGAVQNPSVSTASPAAP